MTITMTLIVIAGDDKYASAGLTHSSIVASADHDAWPLQNERPNQQTSTVLTLRVGSAWAVMVSLPGHLL